MNIALFIFILLFSCSVKASDQGFTVWMNQANDAALEAEVSIDGCEDFCESLFAKYSKGQTPAQALEDYVNENDQVAFEKWLKRVREIAPQYHLKLSAPDSEGAEAEEEYFWLYHWQGGSWPDIEAAKQTHNSPEEAVIEARKFWQGD